METVSDQTGPTGVVRSDWTEP